MSKPHIVGIGGTTRAGSSTEKALRYVLGVCETEGATTEAFAGTELVQLPFYAPEVADRVDLAASLIAELRRADGIVIVSSAYHGTISGLVKNALDYTEDMREDDRPYFSGRSIGCIATGAGWQGVVYTLETLRAIAHSLRGWATPLGAAINTSAGPVFSPEGSPSDERVRFQLDTRAAEVLGFIRRD